jgi:hypothetical protein
MSDSTWEKKSFNVSINLDVDGQLTWAELFWFVDQARKAGVPEDQPVGVKFDDQQDFDGFYFYVDPDDVGKS